MCGERLGGTLLPGTRPRESCSPRPSSSSTLAPCMPVGWWQGGGLGLWRGWDPVEAGTWARLRRQRTSPSVSFPGLNQGRTLSLAVKGFAPLPVTEAAALTAPLPCWECLSLGPYLLAKAEPSLSGQFQVFLQDGARTDSRHPLDEEGRITPNLQLPKLGGTLAPSFTSFVRYFLRAGWESTAEGGGRKGMLWEVTSECDMMIHSHLGRSRWAGAPQAHDLFRKRFAFA